MMLMTVRFRFVIAAITCGILLSSLSGAQDKPLKKVNWGMTALSAAMWIPWIAKDAKIYEKNGLDVEIVLLRGSGQSSQALLGGSLLAAPVALPQVMLADLNGADLVNVAHTIAMASSKLVVKPEIKRPEDLRGKKIATSSIGSLGDFLFRYALRKYGVNPDREITWLSIGTNTERLQALLTGAIDGADVAYPADVQAERKGSRPISLCRSTASSRIAASHRYKPAKFSALLGCGGIPAPHNPRAFALKVAAIQAGEAGTPQFIFLRSTRQTAPIDSALSEYIPYIPANSCAEIFPHLEAAI
jgi:hypothetical protein